MHKILFIFSLIFTGMTGANLVAPVLAHEEQGQTIIHLTRAAFSPNELTISVGTEVIFENVDTVPHWPASNIHPTHEVYPQFDPQKEIMPGASWNFKFTRSGSWNFHDHLFPDIVGTITVTKPESDTRGFFSSSDNIVKQSVLWIFASLKKQFPQLNQFVQAFIKQKNLPYIYQSNIEKNDESLFKNTDSLFSYIKKYGIGATIKYLHAGGAKFGDCHQTAHFAGRIAYEIEGVTAFGKCSAECHSGCYHGAIEAYFKEHGTANLQESLPHICSPDLNPFFLHQCIHGIGHGLTAWSNYDVPKTLALCDNLPTNQASCHSGVFMENIVGGLNEELGHKTKYLSDDPNFPCTVVDEKYRSACYFYQTSRMLALFGGNFAKVAGTCADIPLIYQTTCFQSMGRDVGGVYRERPNEAIAACGNGQSAQMRIDCLVGAVQDAFWDATGADNAISFCKLLEVGEEKAACYNTIFGRAADILTSRVELANFCKKVEENFQKMCQEKISA